jgi:hypothetical protein
VGDISEMKAVEQEIRAARAYAEAIIDTVREPLIVLDGVETFQGIQMEKRRCWSAISVDIVTRMSGETFSPEQLL